MARLFQNDLTFVLMNETQGWFLFGFYNFKNFNPNKKIMNEKKLIKN